MQDNLTACSNCKCPINYECVRFEVFYNGKYKDIYEFTFNKDYTCNDMLEKDETQKTTTKHSGSLF